MCQGVSHAPFMELACICGYKFTTLVFCSLFLLVSGSMGYYISLLLAGASMSIFVIKTLKRYIHHSSNTFAMQSSISRSTILYILGGIQIPLLLIIGFN